MNESSTIYQSKSIDDIQTLQHTVKNWGRLRSKRRDKKHGKYTHEYRTCNGSYMCNSCRRVYKSGKIQCCGDMEHAKCEAELHLFKAKSLPGYIVSVAKQHTCADLTHDMDPSLQWKMYRGQMVAAMTSEIDCLIYFLKIKANQPIEVQAMVNQQDIVPDIVYKINELTNVKPVNSNLWRSLNSYRNKVLSDTFSKVWKRKCKVTGCLATLWYFQSDKTWLVQKEGHDKGHNLV